MVTRPAAFRPHLAVGLAFTGMLTFITGPGQKQSVFQGVANGMSVHPILDSSLFNQTVVLDLSEVDRKEIITK